MRARVAATVLKRLAALEHVRRSRRNPFPWYRRMSLEEWEAETVAQQRALVEAIEADCVAHAFASGPDPHDVTHRYKSTPGHPIPKAGGNE